MAEEAYTRNSRREDGRTVESREDGEAVIVVRLVVELVEVGVAVVLVRIQLRNVAHATNGTVHFVENIIRATALRVLSRLYLIWDLKSANIFYRVLCFLKSYKRSAESRNRPHSVLQNPRVRPHEAVTAC